MDRINEIREYMEEWIRDNVNSDIVSGTQYLKQHLNEVKEKLTSRIRQSFERSRLTADKIVICFLHSSIAMGKNELCLIPFKDNPFITRLENEVYMEYTEIFPAVIVKEDHLKKMIGKKFVQLLPYELEEVRREYMYRYSTRIEELLKMILSRSEGNVDVYFGVYMGEIRKIGKVLV